MSQWFPDFSQRCTDAEIMDGDDYTAEEARGAYQDLRRVNRYLGGTAALLHHLEPLLQTSDSSPVTILDIGSGSADIPRAIARAAQKKSLGVEIVALDRSPQAMAGARDNTRGMAEISLVQAHAVELPFSENAFDFVVASEFLHHLSTDDGLEFLRRLYRLGRVAFLINDLRRHPIPYYSFWALSRLFSANRLIRNDGLISILRGFTSVDLQEIRRRSGLPNLSFHFHFPYRIVMVGKKKVDRFQPAPIANAPPLSKPPDGTPSAAPSRSQPSSRSRLRKERVR